MNAKLKKIDKAKLFLTKNFNLFQCPVCKQRITGIDGQSLVCENNHRFDLSKKGTLFLLKHGVNSGYDDKALWLARRNLLQSGLFDGILDEIIKHLPQKEQKILDIGCGEGTPLSKIAIQRLKFNDSCVGFDISKDAINLATQQDTNNFFCIADLANLPFADQSFDVLIDILSPSAYHEFNRVLKPNGKLFKVIPNANYLIELRHRLYQKESKNYTYSNQDVIKRFKEIYHDFEIYPVKYQFNLTSQLQQDLVKMTPLQWGSSIDISEVLKQPLNQITVDFSLLIAKNQ